MAGVIPRFWDIPLAHVGCWWRRAHPKKDLGYDQAVFQTLRWLKHATLWLSIWGTVDELTSLDRKPWVSQPNHLWDDTIELQLQGLSSFRWWDFSKKLEYPDFSAIDANFQTHPAMARHSFTLHSLGLNMAGCQLWMAAVVSKSDSWKHDGGINGCPGPLVGCPSLSAGAQQTTKMRPSRVSPEIDCVKMWKPPKLYVYYFPVLI